MVKSSIFRKCHLFTIGCFLLWQNLCLADDLLTPAERVWLQAHPEIRVAISPDYPPISFLDAAGKPTGLENDYLNLIESRIGYQFKRVIPSLEARAAISAQGKKVDMLIVFAETEARLEHWNFSKIYLDLPVHLITQEHAPNQFSLENPQKQKLSVVSHYATYDYITQKYPNIVLDKVDDTCTGLQRVSNGTSAGMIADLPVANWCAKQFYLKNLKIAQATGFHYQLGLASRKDWPILASILDKSLASITQRERDTIYLRWNDNILEKSDAEIYKNWILAALLGVLWFLLYRLFQWDKKLKNSFDVQLKNNNVGDLTGTQLTHESKMALRINVITLIAIVTTIIGGFIFVFYFFDNDEYYAMQVIEILLVFFGLVGGLILGSIWRRVEAQHSLNRLLNQTSAREWIERKISLSEDRLENQQLALSTLTQNQLQNWHEPSEVFRELAMISAQTLNVERVGVWLFNAERTQLNCSDLYLKTQHIHVQAEPLIKQALPIYFNALENNRLLVANNVMQHEATVELIKDYMPTHSIGATLEATIWINNQFIGVICHEHVGGVREWTLDEQTFVGSIAALASLTIETHRRRTAEQLSQERGAQLEQVLQARTQSLQESDQRFSYVVQEAPIAILIFDRNGLIVELNNEAASASGYSREYLLGKHFIKTMVAKESRYQAALMAGHAMQGENIKHVELFLQNAAGEKYEYACSIGMTAKDTGNGPGHMVAIAQNISQQRALQNSLIQAREAAEAADRTKSMFVASMSHELRTPLNSIIGFLGVVLQEISGELNPTQKGQLDRAYQSSKHLLLLISDVLDVSKIEAGFLQMNTEKFELKPLLIELEHAVQHLLAGKDLALGIVCAGKIEVTTDRKRLYQVLLNVLSNAVKYTEQGSVQMKAHIEGDQLIVSCKDTGIGIAESDFAKLYQPFERVESPLKIKTPGTGLGLYLTHKILSQLLGGSITVQSELGQGTAFTIIISIDKPANDALTVASDADPNVETAVL